MENAKTMSTPMDASTKIRKEMNPKSKEEQAEMKNRLYRELIGELLYLVNATRPDITFVTSTLSRFCSNSEELHWPSAKRILRYLKGTSYYSIKYIRNKNTLTAYTNSD